MITFDRRTLLLGTAGAVLLAACGSDDSSSTTSNSITEVDGPVLFAAFAASGDFVVSGTEQRLVFAVGSPSGGAESDPAKVPASLTFQVVKGNQRTPMGSPVTVDRHADGVPTPYYPLRFTPDSPGVWGVTTTIDGSPAEQAFQVTAPTDTKLIQVGQKLPATPTATVANPLGVDPLCTRQPEPCSLHTTSLDAALATGKPTVVLVATPEFCQTAICGPVLDLLIEQTAAHPELQFIHAEVFKDAKAKGNLSQATLAEIVGTLGMSYEPALWVAAADGTIVERLDNAFDRTEIAAALAKVS
jgi:hypothetical protein